MRKRCNHRSFADVVLLYTPFHRYTGPALCGSLLERKFWVPVVLSTSVWWDGRGCLSLKRMQFPLTCAFAVTIHKSQVTHTNFVQYFCTIKYSCNTQGSTFVQNVVIDIGKADKSSGLTYVALSRATLDDQIHHCGYPEDRLEKNFKAAGFIARVIEERRCMRLNSVSCV